MIEPEFEDRLSRNTHFLPLHQHLNSCTSGAARCCTYSRSFAMSDDRSNECTKCGPAPDHFGRALIGAKAGIAFLLQVGCIRCE